MRLIVDKFHIIQELSRKCDAIRCNIMNNIRVPNGVKIVKLAQEERFKMQERRKQYSLLKNITGYYLPLLLLIQTKRNGKIKYSKDMLIIMIFVII